MDGRSPTSGTQDHGSLHTDVKAAGVSLTSKPNGVPVAKASLNPVAKAAALSQKVNP